jgi:hypothetical protein
LSNLNVRNNPLNPRFEPLMNLKLADNLQDVLSACFEGGSVSAVSGTKKSETPSWLFEEKKPNLISPSVGFKEEERPTTSGNRRVRAKVESQ